MAGIAFITLSGGADPAAHRSLLKTPSYDLIVVAVPDYATACAVAKELARGGVDTIELCAGFGHQGVAEVARAVPSAHVGAVRFDGHPRLGGASGDTRFGS
jgi:hypothetical protein